MGRTIRPRDDWKVRMPIGGTDDAREIGERVQSLRTGLGLTQRQLAEPKYTAAYVSTVESGKVRASETALRYFAGKLATTYEQLATGSRRRCATSSTHSASGSRNSEVARSGWA